MNKAVGYFAVRSRIAAILVGFLSALSFTSPLMAEEIGDPAKGEKVFRKCASCHMLGQVARNRVGPVLNEIFDRRAASVDGFKYSPALKRAGDDGLVWDREHLDLYIENPKTLVTGTRMNFRGIKDPQDRADLIAYLRLFSASPLNIPESAPTAVPSDPDLDPAILAIQGDPEYGEYLASECLTCHQVDGSDKGIPSIVGWPRDDFVIAMQAYKNKHRVHEVMRMVAGALSDEEIASLAAYFEMVE